MSVYTVSLRNLANEFKLEMLFRSSDFDRVQIITEDVSRPALQLAGFFEHFEPARLQVIGRVEDTYLAGMTPERRAHGLVLHDVGVEQVGGAMQEPLLGIVRLAGLLAAFGLFLSAALSRPVALFTAAVLLMAALMAPDAVLQFPNEFQATAGEKAGLAISRVVIRLTSALSDISPVSDLASSRAVTMRDLGRTVLVDVVAWPCLLLSLTAFILRRKAK